MALSEKTKSGDTVDFANTKDDMEDAFKWEHGDIVRGSYAKTSEGLKNYRDDINRAWGNQDNYKDIYIDTFKRVSDQYLRKTK